MAKTIIVNGYGPGSSNAIALRFGKEGFNVALVARNTERLADGVEALTAKGIKAQAFEADLAQPDQARAVVGKVRKAFGPISVIQWTAYGRGGSDLLTADSAVVRGIFDVAVTSLLASVQEALPDLRAERGAVLVTNGGLGFFDPKVDAMAVAWGAMGLAVANSAKHKLCGVLAAKLRDDGVFVGEVIVNGTIKGTAFDQGNANVDPSAVAAKFWDLYTSRNQTHVTV